MSDSNNNYLLEMKNISKSFPGVKALDQVQLKVHRGSVHALVGENGAGKSTLMKCLFGIYRKDEGQISLDGEEIEFSSARQALEHGVSMVHQELNQVRETRIMDNIWLGRFPIKQWGRFPGFLIDEKKMYEDTLDIFESLDINLDPREVVGNLSVSESQMVEIAKAVSYDSKIIVMDEPTSSLTENEVNHLFRIIRSLRERGAGIIYISHKMEEILKIADQVTVLRDGQWVDTRDSNDITIDEIIALMVGRDLTDRFPEKTNTPGAPILEVKNFTAEDPRSIKDVSFTLRQGEILGIAGLVGSKRTELVESIFGLHSLAEGKLLLKEKEISINHPQEAIQHGFALVTEERRVTGIFNVADIRFNSTIANLEKYINRWTKLLNDKQRTADTQWAIDSMAVKTPSQKTRIESLSGGNQQKVILGRWLLTQPDILLMDEPTRGIDVGAKYEIYQLMLDLASQGKAVVMVSSEMPELLGITDRILVMSEGHLAGIVNTAETNQEEILTLAAKYI